MALMLFLLFGCLLISLGTGRVLRSLPAYEERRQQQSKNVTRVKNVDVVAREEGVEDVYCHLVEMNRHSLMAGPSSTTFPADFPLESLAAVVLALEHLNSGDGSVIPQVEGLREWCNVVFTSEFIDTAGLESQALDTTIAIIQRDPQEQQLPCAFLGAFRSSVSIATALYTSLKGYPQMSAISNAGDLDNKETFPLFGKTVVTSSNYATPLLKFLTESLNVRHLAVIHTDNPTGISYVNGLQEAVAKDYPNVVLKTVGYSDFTASFKTTVKALKDTGYRYIFAVTGIDQFGPLIKEAYRQGIVGTGQHSWIVSNKAIPTTYLSREFEPEDPMLKACLGLLTFDASVGSLEGVGRYDEYIAAWQQLAESEEDLAFLQSKVPRYPDDPGYNPVFSADTFGIGRFTASTAPIYDAAIAIGLGACHANNVRSNVFSDKYFDGPQHYAAILNSSFVGASGTITLDPQTGSRTSQSAVYVMTNAIAVPVEGSNNVTMQEVRTHYYDTRWIAVENTSLVFNDGTETILQDLPDQIVDYNYIGLGLRAAGLAMSALVVTMSIGLSGWTFSKSKTRIVKASQPIFLFIICFGTLLMGASVIPLSLDDGVVSEQGASVACASFPWLLSLGWCISFSALFSKTKRINAIFHNPKFRRVKVEARDVMRPMLVLLVLNVALLATWTAVAPLEWQREITSVDDYGRASESQGQCSSDNPLPFFIPLVIINLGALGYAIMQAYVARKISTEFAESEWIARAMGTIMVVSFVGLPVLVIAEDDPRAFYFVLTALIFVVCSSLLCFIFVPKILNHQDAETERKEHIGESLERMKNRNSVAGTGGRYSIRLSTFSSSSSGESSGEVEGTKILEHPKLRAGLDEELVSLKEQNMRLKKKLEELVGPEPISKDEQARFS